MSYSVLLQDWTTVRGTTGTTTVIQQEAGYADLIGIKDLVVFAEVSHITNGPDLRFLPGRTRQPDTPAFGLFLFGAQDQRLARLDHD